MAVLAELLVKAKEKASEDKALENYDVTYYITMALEASIHQLHDFFNPIFRFSMTCTTPPLCNTGNGVP